LANFKRLSWAISWVSFSISVWSRLIFLPMVSTVLPIVSTCWSSVSTRLAQRVDLVLERLDTLYQLRRQGAQLFRGQVREIGKRSHDADFARAGNLRR